MGEASRTAMMTTLFKDKPGAERSDWAMYRPVSVTTILYRVYGGCLEQCLSPAMKYMLGDPQIGYQKGRKIDENIDLVTEIIRYINNDAPLDGGLLGRYPTGSGARTVVASLPLAPPSGRRRGPPRRASRHPPHHEALPPCAHSLFEPRFESPTRRPKAPSGISQWDLRSSHSEVAAFRVGNRSLPSGKSRGASGKSRGAEWEVEWPRVALRGCGV